MYRVVLLVVSIVLIRPHHCFAHAAASAPLGQSRADLASAQALETKGQYRAAVAAAERACAWLQDQAGAYPLELARCDLMLGRLFLRLALHGRAEPLLRRALSLREVMLGPNHPDVAEALHALGALEHARGDFARAEPLYQQALALRQVALGFMHCDVAQSLHDLGVLYHDWGKPALGETYLRRALEMRKTLLGPWHADVARSLYYATLTNIVITHKQALPIYQEALQIAENALAPEHPDVAHFYNVVSSDYYMLGRYDLAEEPAQRALQIWDTALGPNHPLVGRALITLGNVYRELGDFKRAEPLYLRSLQIRETTLGPGHFLLARSLEQLGKLYWQQKRYHEAEPLFQRAFAIRAAIPGQPQLGNSLADLAGLYERNGDPIHAELLIRQALQSTETTLRPDHPEAAELRGRLGRLRANQSDDVGAIAQFAQAIAIMERNFVRLDVPAPGILHQWAQLELARDRLGPALALLERAWSISEARFREQVVVLSESRLAALTRFQHAQAEQLYSMLRPFLGLPAAQRLVLAVALLRKGRSVEEIIELSRKLVETRDPQSRALFDEVRRLRLELAAMNRRGAQDTSLAEQQNKLKALAAQGDAVERALAKRSAPVRALTAFPAPAEIVDRVAAALKPGSVLIEFLAYTDALPLQRVSVDRAPDQRYLAVMLAPGGHTRAFDLGPAAPIERAAKALHEALSRADRDPLPAAQAAYRRLLAPLMPHLGGYHHLILSPDGALNRFPFQALHDGHDYLFESLDTSNVTSGRDLLRGVTSPHHAAAASDAVVFADPDFSLREAAETRPVRSESVQAALRGPWQGGGSTQRTLFDGRHWTGLPGARREAEAIARMFPRSRLFLGTDATAESLLAVTAPRILHMATHGFFLGADAAALSDRGSRAIRKVGESVGQSAMSLSEDPMLRSGLTLAGAKPVTALELSGLNLWGTELVVLSACDTGRGAIESAQGVLGLRRAFTVAGAASVISSLWKVDDAVTAVLMEQFYRGLAARQSRLQALREAMRTVRKTHPHPRYWAPFILIGQSGPLSLSATEQ